MMAPDFDVFLESINKQGKDKSFETGMIEASHNSLSPVHSKPGSSKKDRQILIEDGQPVKKEDLLIEEERPKLHPQIKMEKNSLISKDVHMENQESVDRNDEDQK